MEEKRHGVKITLLNELKQFQLYLLNHKKKMPFIGVANVSYSDNLIHFPLIFTRSQIQANDGRLSVDNTIHNLPGNANIEHAENHVTIKLKEHLYIKLIFDTIEEKDFFVGALGLNESSSSSNYSSPDSERE